MYMKKFLVIFIIIEIIQRNKYLLCKIPDIGTMFRVFANGPRDQGSIQGQVISKTQKMILDAFLLNNIIRYRSRIKWSNPEEGVAPSPTPWCSNY